MDELQRLFGVYRDSLPDPEPSAAFTPGVWQRIEARRSPLRTLRRMTEAFVTLAAVVTILIGAFLIPRMQASPVYQATYVDVLNAENSAETMAYAEVLPAPADPLPR